MALGLCKLKLLSHARLDEISLGQCRAAFIQLTSDRSELITDSIGQNGFLAEAQA